MIDVWNYSELFSEYAYVYICMICTRNVEFNEKKKEKKKIGQYQKQYTWLLYVNILI